MAYFDKRAIDAKLREHRFWNTDEIKIESASTGIFDDFWNGIKSLQSTSNYNLETCLHTEIKKGNGDAIAGIVRLTVFCSTETPNRFKAIFPAFLIKNDLARIEEGTFVWAGSKTTRTPQITIEKLVKILSGKETSRYLAASQFCAWAENCGADRALTEVATHGQQLPNFINALSARLAQGADTNKRGHGATDKIKVKLREYGFTPELQNTNSSDVAVSDLVPEYSGPRKYDTVVFNALGSLCLISQSQMYSSDVGSVQGKSVEEDSSANQLLKSKWKDCCVLTHTEGFGCHTTMTSRLRHVLNSEVDGFIQLKTLDIKLLTILRQCNCPSLIDLEQSLVENSNGLPLDDLVTLVSKKFGFEESLTRKTVEFYIKNNLLDSPGGGVAKITLDRLSIAIKHRCIQRMVDASRNIDENLTTVWRIGGLDSERFITESDFQVVMEYGRNLAKVFSTDFHAVEKLIEDCEAIQWVP